MPTVKGKTPAKRPTPTVKKPSRVAMPEDWKLALALIEAGAPRVLLYGPPGTGKTYTAQHAAKVNGELATVFVLPCTEDTPSSDVFGTDTIRGGDVVWRDGIGGMAWRVENSRLVLDELDKASPEMLTSLLKICDEEDSAGFHLPSGEFMTPRPGLQVIACMNGEPEDLPEALADRFTVRVRIVNPHPEAIMALSDDLWDVARETTHGKVPEARRYSIRQFRAFDKLRKLGLKETDAATAAFEERGKDLLATLRIKRKASTLTKEEANELTSVLASFGALAEVVRGCEMAMTAQEVARNEMGVMAGMRPSPHLSSSGHYHAIEKYSSGQSDEPIAFLPVPFTIDARDGYETDEHARYVVIEDGEGRWVNGSDSYNTALGEIEKIDLITGKEIELAPTVTVSALSATEVFKADPFADVREED